jgi:ATP-dependent DNA ligase
MATRNQLTKDLAQLKTRIEQHPWRDRDIGAQSRWSAGKDLSWEPLRPERVCEVKYDHMQGHRFRHAAIFLRWRPDKPARECRYDQLEVTNPYELQKVFFASKAARA